MLSVAVCGLGKLGSSIAVVFAASGYKVMGLDVDEKKVRKINNREAPVDETDLYDYLQLPEVMENLTATTKVTEAVATTDACFFVTPTPSMSDGSFDHTMLLNAITNVAHEVASRHKRNYLFIVNSTVMPTFLNLQVVPTLERILGNLGFELAYKPEFIALGTVIRDLLYPDVLLIGAKTEETAHKLEHFYREVVLHDCQAKKISLVEAELAKISLNCAVTMKISFANQVAMVARKLGADPLHVLSAVGHDHRVGHAALRPGLPFGGPCFPRDNRMFQYVANSVGERAPLAEATDVVNRNLLRACLARVPEHGTVGILGLSYKPNTSHSDESAGLYWYKVMRSRSRKVYAYDPRAPHPNTLEEVLGCDFIFIGCLWPEFKEITVRPETAVLDLTGEVMITKSRTVRHVSEFIREKVAS